MIKVFVCVTAIFSVSSALAGEQCLDNFSSDGNFLTGRIYKTSAVVSGVNPQDAFPRAYAFTAENGFSILSSNKEAGVISAAQSVSYGKGKTVPLNITFKEENGGTRIAMSYATSGGVVSPEDAIKRHFCMTIQAASVGAKGSNTVASAPSGNFSAGKGSTAVGFVAANAEQQAALSRELSKPQSNEKIRIMINEATPVISDFIGKLACLADHKGASALNEFAAPGALLGLTYQGNYPMRDAQYHSRTACMTVSRIQGWVAPANNALKFEVLYKADDSGEISKKTHEVVKQADGVWLFRN